MNKLAFLLVTVALFGPCFAQDTNKTQVATNTKNVTIIGTIKNFDEFAAVVVPETYIQLVPISDKGTVETIYDHTGLISYKSDLPKLSVPKNAAFSFNVPNTPPGKYFIAAQKLHSGTSGRMPHCFITDKERAFYVIEVKADAQSPHTVNTGDMIVWIH